MKNFKLLRLVFPVLVQSVVKKLRTGKCEEGKRAVIAW